MCEGDNVCVYVNANLSRNRDSLRTVKDLASPSTHPILLATDLADTHATALQDAILAEIEHFNAIDLSSTILGRRSPRKNLRVCDVRQVPGAWTEW